MAGETEKVAMSVRGDLNVEQDLTVERDLVVADDLKVTDTISADGLFMAPSATRYRFSTGRYNLVIDRSENRGYEDNILQIPIHVSVGQVIRKISARIRRDIGSNCNSGGFTRMNIVEHDFDSGGEIGIPGVDVPHEVTQLAVFDLSHLVYQVKDRRSYAIQIIARRGDGQFDFNCKLEFRGALVEVEADRFSLGGTR